MLLSLTSHLQWLYEELNWGTSEVEDVVIIFDLTLGHHFELKRLNSFVEAKLEYLSTLQLDSIHILSSFILGQIRPNEFLLEVTKLPTTFSFDHIFIFSFFMRSNVYLLRTITLIIWLSGLSIPSLAPPSSTLLPRICSSGWL